MSSHKEEIQEKILSLFKGPIVLLHNQLATNPPIFPVLYSTE